MDFRVARPLFLLAAALFVPACSPDGGEGTPDPALGDFTGSGPPGAPTGLTAKAGDATVILSWEAVPGAGSYNVKSATVQGGPYGLVQALHPETTIVDADLQNGVTYYYRVSAVNAHGEGQDSEEVSTTPRSGGRRHRDRSGDDDD